MKCLSATVEYNPHTVYYMTIPDYLEEAGMPRDWVDEDSVDLWDIIVYPSSPVSNERLLTGSFSEAMRFLAPYMENV